MSTSRAEFRRVQATELATRLAEPRRFVQVWRERTHEVDFVMQVGRKVVAIEVKSGRAPQAHAGTTAFARSFKVHRTLLVGADGIAVGDFLAQPIAHWLQT